MMKCSTRAAAAATALMVICAGPVTTAAPAAPPKGGTISVEQGAAGGNADRAAPAYVDAVSGALAAKGFTILNDPGHSAYIAELFLSRTEVGTGSARVARGRGAVVPGASAGVGAGMTIPLSAGHSRSVPLERIQLELRVRKRGQDAMVWHGAAVTVRAAGTKQGADEMIAADLSEAILRSYPDEPEGVTGVP